MREPGPTAGRTRLTSNRTFHVRLDGSDANSGLEDSAQGAFRTIQRAIDVTYEALDLKGFHVVVKVGHGTHTAPFRVIGQPIGAHGAKRPLQIIGDESKPSNVELNVGSETAVSVGQGAHLLIAGVRTSTNEGGHGWMVSQATLEHRNCEFGDVAKDMILATDHAVVRAIGPLHVAGNAISFVHATTHSLVTFADQEIRFNGNRFGIYLWGLNDATVAIDGCLIGGARPAGYTRVHNHSLLNSYRLRNPDGWGFLGVGNYNIEDGSCVTADGYRQHRFYVRSDADGDQNDGLENSKARAFRTIQACLDHVARLPFNPAAFFPSSGVTISVADGTYEGAHLWDLKYFDATLQGNVQEPQKVVIRGAENALVAAGRTKWTVKGFTLTAETGCCILAKRGAQIDYDAIDFGSAAQYHVLALHGAVTVQTGPCSISGGAMGHIAALYGSVADVSKRTMEIAGEPQFSDAFIRARNNSAVRAVGTQFRGSATGRRFDAGFNGSIDVGGAGRRALPGNASGSTGRRGTAGQYG